MQHLRTQRPSPLLNKWVHFNLRSRLLPVTFTPPRRELRHPVPTRAKEEALLDLASFSLSVQFLSALA
jgi:hypothetical protein